MNWKTTIIALMILITATPFGVGYAWAGQHCNANPEAVINLLTASDSYGESVVATGESVAGTFTFYGEAFDPEVGGKKSPDTRTFTILRDGVVDEQPSDTIQCSMTVGTNFRVLPASAQGAFSDGFIPVMTALDGELVAFIVIMHPDNDEWKILRIDYMNTPFQFTRVMAQGTDFVMYSDLDPEPEPVEPTTPWDG